MGREMVGGRHTEGINNICNVYSFEMKRMKIQLIFGQTICGYAGVHYLLRITFLVHRNFHETKLIIQKIFSYLPN